jgi:hypothetical protein
MNSATLTSLAMLKVQIDKGQDYLDYLRPFILQILSQCPPAEITDSSIQSLVLEHFGLDFPVRAVQIVLGRLTKKIPLRREMGVYRLVGTLDDPGILLEKANAERHIRAVVLGLIEFSRETPRTIASEDVAVEYLLAFLSQFDISCLKAYVGGTALPRLEGTNESKIVCVSEYLLKIQATSPERFESFLVLVQGHMLANAILCPDLQNAPKTYERVTFYFDTPLLVRLLGLEGDLRQAATRNLVTLVQNLGGAVAVFSHSRQELEAVVKGAADYIQVQDGRGAIVMEARKRGTTKSDMLLLAGKIDEILTGAKVSVERTPKYIFDFQIDEKAFEGALEDEVSYRNPRAKEYDINSVRSIYVLRKGLTPTSVERAKAVLVSSNQGFARAAYHYGQQHEETREVSSVITDFSLANVAWLKAPLGAPSLPATETMAFAYAALQPSPVLLRKYLTEIEKLEQNGTISARDHQLLRSSTLAQEELVRLTLGDEDALTQETIMQTLTRVTQEITKEESDRLSAEKVAHHETQAALAKELTDRRKIEQNLYWTCDRRAKRTSWTVAVMLACLLIAGGISGYLLKSTDGIIGLFLLFGSISLIVFGFVDLFWGLSVLDLRGRLEHFVRKRLISYECSKLGITLGDK